MTWFKNLKVRNKLLLSFMFILVLAVGVSLYELMEMRFIDSSYEDAIDLTEDRFGHIFEAQEHFANVRLIMREIYYPENTMTELNAYYAAIDKELDSVREELNGLHEIASGDVRHKVESILPLLERYRTETKGVINILRSVGTIDLDNPDYRDAQERAQEEAQRITNEFGGFLYTEIGEIPMIALNVLKTLGDTLGAEADRAQAISVGALVIMALIILAMALYISGLISKPLISVTSFMQKAGSTGDITLRPEDVESINRLSQVKDELGELSNSAASFIRHVTKIANHLEAISGRDLTVEIELLSDADTIGKSLKIMVDNLNKMFAEINASASLVSSGSNQVAETAGSIASSASQMAGGAQALAEGSTKQAVSMKELSHSVAGIAEKTKANADMTGQAAKLADTIINKAEKGNRQMDEMIIAVNDITEASKSISNIMETINSIAAQTNLLSLNAAIEAARAGEQGRGFAVVAEEVRKLAAQSQEAASETGSIIQNSIQKAELGARVAGEMAVSLKEIIAGITESSRLILAVAQASEDQLLSISQINVTVDQVAEIVQQNSALAEESAAASEESAAASEESAAASEEMSSQSAILQELISQFKLKKR